MYHVEVYIIVLLIVACSKYIIIRCLFVRVHGPVSKGLYSGVEIKVEG